jgi:hypothetical protein
MNIETKLKYFLQRDIVLSLNSKILKEGKLVLFSEKDYYLYLYLKHGNSQQKKIEIPYPFDITIKDNYLILDYTLASISKNDSELYYRLMSLNQKNNSKFYNNKILLFEKNKLDLSVVT